MGQISCQCTADPTPHHSRALSDHPLSQRIITTLTLSVNSQPLPLLLQPQQTLLFGTTPSCRHSPPSSPPHSLFALAIRESSQAVLVRDTGLGLGVFILRKKLGMHADNSEHMVAVGDGFLVLRMKPNNKVVHRWVGAWGEESGESSAEEDLSLSLGDEIKMTLRRQEGDRGSYILKRKGGNREMWVWLGRETRLRPRDVLRAGSQFMEVDTVRSYLQSSAVVMRY